MFICKFRLQRKGPTAHQKAYRCTSADIEAAGLYKNYDSDGDVSRKQREEAQKRSQYVRIVF